MNRTRAVELTEAANIDALIASTPENVTYLSGYRSYTQLHLKNKVFALLATRASEPALVVPMIDTGALALMEEAPEDIRFYGRVFLSSDESENGETRGRGRRRGSTAVGERASADENARRYIGEAWPRVKPSAVEALASAVEDWGLSSSNIGVDDDGMTPEMFEQFRRRLPNARLVGASQLLKQVRMVKTPKEVELLRKSTRIAERAIELALDAVDSKTTEISLAHAIQIEMTRHAEPGIVNAYGGRDSAYVLRSHQDKRIKLGDQIWLDVGCWYEGYCSDTGTTAVRGQPREKLRRYHEAVVRGQRMAIEAIQAGVTPAELHRIAVAEVVKTIPSFRRDQVGHGLGLEHYEPPALSATDHTPLEAGMVINVETPYYEIGFGGVMVEDTVLVREGGCEFLTELNKDLRVVG